MLTTDISKAKPSLKVNSSRRRQTQVAGQIVPEKGETTRPKVQLAMSFRHSWKRQDLE